MRRGLSQISKTRAEEQAAMTQARKMYDEEEEEEEEMTDAGTVNPPDKGTQNEPGSLHLPNAIISFSLQKPKGLAQTWLLCSILGGLMCMWWDHNCVSVRGDTVPIYCRYHTCVIDNVF